MFIFAKAAMGLLLVLFMLYVISKVLQKYTKIGHSTSGSTIKLDGVMYVDDSTKVVNVTHGSVCYLILVSKNGNLLLDKYEAQ